MIKKVNLFLFLFLAFASSLAAKAVEVKYFYKTGCKGCIYFKENVLPGLKQRYHGRVVWKKLDISQNRDAFIELYNLNIARGEDSLGVPAVLIGNELLTGPSEIANNFDDAYRETIETSKADKTIIGKKNLKQIYEKMSLPAVLFFGLIDGLNPCAFAVIVFFVSFLAVYGYGRKEMVYVGSAYCLAVFICYVLLGLGVFKAIYLLSGFHLLIKIFYWLVAGLCFVFFVFSIYDLARYKKTGKSEGMLLQLPKPFKIAINKVFGKFLRGKNKAGILKMTLAAFVVGFLVSIIEAVCTGQVYVPVLTFIVKESGLKTKAFFYLLLYNIMFIMPLVAVFILSLAGYKSKSFDGFLKKHLAMIKVILAFVFLLLGLMLVDSQIYFLQKILSGIFG
jgi:cytochrome c biogenesis protein CcdA